MTQILRFEMNVPAEVALKEAGLGKPIEGRYGNRVMYTLADDRVMYVAPSVASRSSYLDIQPGELFHVCKQVKKQRTKRLIEWQVERLPSDPDTQLERELKESIAAAHAVKANQTGLNEEASPQAPPVLPESITASCESATATTVPATNASENGIPASGTRNGDGAQSVVYTDRAAKTSAVPLPPHTPALAAPPSNDAPQ